MHYGVTNPLMHIAASPAELPADARALFGPDLFASTQWYESVVAACLALGDQTRFCAISVGDRLTAVLPLCLNRHGTLRGLSTVYSCLWHPLLAPDLTAAEITQTARAMADALAGHAVVTFDAMPADDDQLTQVLAAIPRRRALRFAHFGNWYLDVAGMDWPAYLASRPGPLRTAIQRRTRHLMTREAGALCLTQTIDAIDAAISAYESVYARSWKPAEPFATFNPTLMRTLARDGLLRLGILTRAGHPIAAQFWAVYQGRATVMKLAHDEAHRALSPGTVLSGLMIKHLITQDHVQEIDFGRGDDDYKAAWTGSCRKRIGVVLADPGSIAGGFAILRQTAAGMVREIRQ